VAERGAVAVLLLFKAVQISLCVCNSNYFAPISSFLVTSIGGLGRSSRGDATYAITFSYSFFDKRNKGGISSSGTSAAEGGAEEEDDEEEDKRSIFCMRTMAKSVRTAALSLRLALKRLNVWSEVARSFLERICASVYNHGWESAWEAVSRNLDSGVRRRVIKSLASSLTPCQY